MFGPLVTLRSDDETVDWNMYQSETPAEMNSHYGFVEANVQEFKEQDDYIDRCNIY